MSDIYIYCYLAGLCAYDTVITFRNKLITMRVYLNSVNILQQSVKKTGTESRLVTTFKKYISKHGHTVFFRL